MDFHDGVKRRNFIEFSFARWRDVGLQKKITEHLQGKAEFPIFEELIEKCAKRFAFASA